MLLFGLSDTTYLGAPLPIDLSPIGATGCSAYISIDFQTVVLADGNGGGTYQASVPNDPSLVSAHFYNQWVALVPGANPLGLLTSNYGSATIGG